MSQRNSGAGQRPVTRCSTTEAGTGSLSVKTRSNASSNTAYTIPVAALAAPYRAAAGPAREG